MSNKKGRTPCCYRSYGLRKSLDKQLVQGMCDSIYVNCQPSVWSTYVNPSTHQQSSEGIFDMS